MFRIHETSPANLKENEIISSIVTGKHAFADEFLDGIGCSSYWACLGFSPGWKSTTLSFLFGKRNSWESGVENQTLESHNILIADLCLECKYFAPILLDFRIYSKLSSFLSWQLLPLKSSLERI